ncbi:MarR family winged helix-turn-helix transcriptional regulator [Bacillus manliponensis]|uniref:MarR family winged helix-turn-helix transcriptional regulator n=1 Tax=Bacillus manliponensis TaxID=574376 RepID=UPI0035183628
MKQLNKHWETIYYHLRYEYETNLSHQSIRILQMIAKENGLTIGQIAEALRLSPNTASEHVKRLIQKKLIMKERSKQDERIVVVTLTTAGLEVLTKHTLLDDEKLATLQSCFSEEEQQLISSAFELLAKEAKHVFPR